MSAAKGKGCSECFKITGCTTSRGLFEATR